MALDSISELGACKLSITVKPKESFLLSIARDSVTFGFLLLCIYVSQGSAWWTFFTGTFFIAFLGAKLISALKTNTTVFSSKSKAVEFIQKSDSGRRGAVLEWKGIRGACSWLTPACILLSWSA